MPRGIFADSTAQFNRAEHLRKVGLQTRFKSGEMSGSQHPMWKGGRLAVAVRKFGISESRYLEMLEKQVDWRDLQ